MIEMNLLRKIFFVSVTSDMKNNETRKEIME
jgi:hypothetical protein